MRLSKPELEKKVFEKFIKHTCTNVVCFESCNPPIVTNLHLFKRATCAEIKLVYDGSSFNETEVIGVDIKDETAYDAYGNQIRK